MAVADWQAQVLTSARVDAECCPHVPRFQVSELGRTSIIQGALAMARANLGTDPQGR